MQTLITTALSTTCHFNTYFTDASSQTVIFSTEMNNKGNMN